MITFIAALAIFLATLSLARASHAVPALELRRQARSGKNSGTMALYKVVSYGPSLDIFLWLVGSGSFTVLVLSAADLAWWLAAVVVFLGGVLLWLKVPAQHGDGLFWGIAKITAIPAAWLLSYLQPLLIRMAGLAHLKSSQTHTGAYEKEDLAELIKGQHHQIDNRIDEVDLQTALGALTFGDKTVGSVMTPSRKVKLVAATELIGPHLMDELHASGFSRFPVVKDSTRMASAEIIGTLYLRDLVGHQGSGKIKDLTRPEVFFINESQTLREALGAFLKTQHHLLIVVNNFEEIVGVLSMEDVIEQIIGEKIIDEFDRYNDLRAVAGLEAKKDRQTHKQVAGRKSEVIE